MLKMQTHFYEHRRCGTRVALALVPASIVIAALGLGSVNLIQAHSQQIHAKMRGEGGTDSLPSALVMASLWGVRRARKGVDPDGGSARKPIQGVGCLSFTQARAFIESLDRSALVAVTDAQGTILFANANFCRIAGYAASELVGSNHRILGSWHHPKSFWKDMYRQVVSGRVWHGEVCNRSKCGEEYWADTTISAVRSEDGSIRQFIALGIDISERKRVECELLATKDELECAACEAADLNAELKENCDKLFEAKSAAECATRAKSEFLANMSHEIRTPLSAIVGFAEILADEHDRGLTPAQRADYLRTICRQGKHLLGLINNILDLAKVESGKLSTERIQFDPATILDDTSQMLAHQAGAKGIEFRCESEPGVPDWIESDPTRLRQVLTNLVENAIKFTDCGFVEIRLRPCSITEERAIEFVVSDSGLGMDEPTMARIFRAFEQADTSTTRRYGGTGLGLRISKQLAIALGGDIRVESVPGSGSVFTVRLPIQRSAPAAKERDTAQGSALRLSRPQRADGPAGAIALTGVRILLAEDGDENAVLITHHLKRAGAVVTRVVNGLEAVRALYGQDCDAEHPSGYDAVIMDMQMPVMDGYTAASVIRDRGANIPIIAATAHAMAEDRNKCLAAGCTDYVSKPINSAALLSAVREAVDQGGAAAA